MEKKKKDLTPNPRDAQFLNLINSWVRRFQNKLGRKLAVGHDFSIDFENLGVHPLNVNGNDFVNFIKDQWR